MKIFNYSVLETHKGPPYITFIRYIVFVTSPSFVFKQLAVFNKSDIDIIDPSLMFHDTNAFK